MALRCGGVRLAVLLSALGAGPGFGLEAQVPRPAPEQAVRELIAEYFAAFAREDLDALISLWSAQAPDLDAVRRTQRGLFNIADYEFDDLYIDHLQLDAATAEARVSVTRTEYGPEPGRRREARLHRLFRFVREGTRWSLWSDEPAATRLAEALVDVADDAERLDLLAAEPELVNEELVDELLRLADTYHARGDLEPAVRGYELVGRLAARIGARRTAGRAWQNLGNIAYVRREFDRALTMYARRLSLATLDEDPQGVANASLSLATTHYSLSEYNRALELYERALRREREQGREAGIADLLTSIGNVHYLQAGYELARAAYLEARALHERVGNRLEVARIDHALGRTHAAAGALVSSALAFERARAGQDSLGDLTGLAATWYEMGRVRLRQGQLAEAASAFEACLSLETTLDNASGRGRVLLALGLLHATREAYPEALEVYDASRAAFAEAGEAVGVGYALLGRGSVQLEAGELDAALAAYADSRRRFEQLRDRLGEARARTGSAITLTRLGRFDEAIENARRAAGLAADVAAPDIAWQARYQEGRAQWLAGRRDAARLGFLSAIAVLEESRLESGAVSDEIRALTDRTAPYVAMVEWWVAAGDLTRALEYAERARRRVLQDASLVVRRAFDAGMTSVERDASRRLAAERHTKSEQVRRARRAPEPVGPSIEALQASLRQARERFDAHEREMYDKHPRLARLRFEGALVAPDRILDLVGPRTAVLLFVMGNGGAVAFAITAAEGAVTATSRAAGGGEPARSARIHAETIPVGRQALAARVERFRLLLRDRDPEALVEARALYDLLVAPLQAHLDRELIVIVPDGELARLPFHALRSGAGRFLVEHAAVSYAPSLGALATALDVAHEARLRAGRGRSPRALLHVPAPEKTGGSQTGSDRVQEEARALERLYGDRIEVRQGQDPARVRVLDGADRGDLLHFGLEWRLDDVSPWHSALVVPAGDGREPGPDTADRSRVEAWELLGARSTAAIGVVSRAVEPRTPSTGEGVLGPWWALVAAGSPTLLVLTDALDEGGRLSLVEGFHTRAIGLMRDPAALGVGDLARAWQQAVVEMIRDPATAWPGSWAHAWLIGAP